MRRRGGCCLLGSGWGGEEWGGGGGCCLLGSGWGGGE